MFKTILLAFCCVFSLPIMVFAGLEGGLTTNSREWTRHPVATMIKPSEEERKKELAQREEDVAAQIKALEARLKRVPDEATMARVKKKLEEIKANCGWVPEIQHVFALREMQHMIDNSDTLDPGLLKGYKQFQADLKKRDIDLIVIPFPGNSHFYTHRLVEGVDETDELYPGYTKMLLTFLENDIEVVDVLYEFRKAANADIPVHWPNDPHTASVGRKIAAEKLAERLQRYDFARRLRVKNRDNLSYKVVEWTGAKTGWSQYLLNARVMGNNRKDPLKSSNIPDVMPVLKKRPMKRLESVYKPKKEGDPSRFDTASAGYYDMVLVGDSQLHSAVFGDGLPDFVNTEVGGICRWGSKSWSGFSLPAIYLETATNQPENQPRVVVVFHLFFKLPASESGESEYAPKPLPEMKAAPAEGEPGTLPFNARVRVTKFSKPKDPNSVSYKEALMMAEAEIIEGPLKGKKIGLVHEVMYKGRLAKKFEKNRTPRFLNEIVNMRLMPWELAIKNDPKLGTIMIYDDTELDLDAPIFWVEQGPLDQHAMRSR